MILMLGYDMPTIEKVQILICTQNFSFINMPFSLTVGISQFTMTDGNRFAFV